MARALPAAPLLEALILRRCGADDATVDLVCRALQAGHGLTRLELGGAK